MSVGKIILYFFAAFTRLIMTLTFISSPPLQVPPKTLLLFYLCNTAVLIIATFKLVFAKVYKKIK